MGKKSLLFIVILILILIASVHAYQNGTQEFNELFSTVQDFDGHFTMKVPPGEHYSDVAWCRPNGALGCLGEYWEDEAGCYILEDDMVIYYYNNSWLVNGESNAWQHATNVLESTYLYNSSQNDGDLLILTGTVSMKNMPKYVVGVHNNDGSDVVFVGGYDLDKLKYYASTVEFN